jgi:hypothetical protein
LNSSPTEKATNLLTWQWDVAHSFEGYDSLDILTHSLIHSLTHSLTATLLLGEMFVFPSVKLYVTQVLRNPINTLTTDHDVYLHNNK